MQLSISPHRLNYSYLGHHWSLDLVNVDSRTQILSDDKPFGTTVTQQLINDFWEHEPASTWILKACLAKMPEAGPVPIANQLAHISTYYLGTYHRGKILDSGREIYGFLAKPSMALARERFPRWRAEFAEAPSIYSLDSSSLHPSVSLHAASAGIWFEIYDQLLTLNQLSLETPLPLKRGDSRAPMCGACVPYSCGLGRIDLGIALLRSGIPYSATPQTLSRYTRREEFLEASLGTDLGSLLPYQDIGVNVNQMVETLPLIPESQDISLLSTNGVLHRYSRNPGRWVEYNGGHVFSYMPGPLHPERALIEASTPREFFERLSERYRVKCEQLPPTPWKEYLLQEIEIRRRSLPQLFP